MTPDGISTADWNRVHEAACRIVNAIMMDDDVLSDHHTSSLFEILDELERRYGRLPSILATRADFSDDPLEAIPLLEEALALSTDALSSRLALQSLVTRMIEGGHDDNEVEARLAELDELSDEQTDPSDFEEALDLRSEFERKKAARSGGEGPS
ncbi:MAG: hypothetical protein EOP88_26685 [Verrucomicrobiaceae bacterium]|nr:MAG: hypothetical protein EOP88_26685 [Verrucomicrobiaceae bacterium]